MKLVVAFIEMLGFISFQQSKGLIPHKLYIIKTIALPRSKNPELSYQTHASATEIFTSYWDIYIDWNEMLHASSNSNTYTSSEMDSWSSIKMRVWDGFIPYGHNTVW